MKYFTNLFLFQITLFIVKNMKYDENQRGTLEVSGGDYVLSLSAMLHPRASSLSELLC